jgi:hypothetical protein
MKDMKYQLEETEQICKNIYRQINRYKYTMQVGAVETGKKKKKKKKKRQRRYGSY